MKRSIAAVAATLSTLLAFAASTPAGADPDAHMPDVRTGYCPGGNGSQPLSIIPGAAYGAIAYYCNGVPYADGSFWRYVQFPIPWSMIGDPQQNASYGLHCVTAVELMNSSFAPPGGCDGAV